MKRVLLVSNGVGEDMIAATLGRALADAGADVTAYPLVGRGAYPAGVPLLDPRLDLPSGGFSLRADLRGIWSDLAGGLVRLWLAQRRTLSAQRGRFDLVVAVGDTYCLFMAGAAAPHVAFVSTADSVRISPFGVLARMSMRRHAARVFTRDPDTAEALRAMGHRAQSAGSVMMDHLEPTGETFGLSPDVPVVTLLPGSRMDAPDNAALLAQTAAAVAAKRSEVRFLMALAPGVNVEAVRARIAPRGISIFLTPRFADALHRAGVVIGLAGTANEQAAGLGKPVVAFPGTGTQFGPQFLRTQHRLLGDAVVPTRSWREAAEAVVQLIGDPAERRRRGEVGRQRMGGPGATQRVVAGLLQMLAA